MLLYSLKGNFLMKCLMSSFILLLLTGCNSPEPIQIKTAGNTKPLSSVQCGKKIAVSPIVLIYKEDRTVREKLPFKGEIKFNPIPSQQQQDEIKAKIFISLSHLLEQEGFVIQKTNQETETLLAEVSSHHDSLILQYHSKDSFQDLLTNISTLSGADCVILAEVLIEQGVPGHYDFVFSGSVRESTSSTSFKIACISAQDAKHKWYSEIYMREFMEEADIENILNMLILKVN